MPLDLCGTRFDESSNFLLALFPSILLFPQVFLYGVEEIIHLEGLDCVTVGAPVHRIINMVRLVSPSIRQRYLGCAGSNN